MEQAVSNQINTTKLLAVEKLLWGHTPKKPGERMQGMQHMAACMKPHATLHVATAFVLTVQGLAAECVLEQLIDC